MAQEIGTCTFLYRKGDKKDKPCGANAKWDKDSCSYRCKKHYHRRIICWGGPDGIGTYRRLYCEMLLERNYWKEKYEQIQEQRKIAKNQIKSFTVLTINI